jgi:hypothetical protein
MPIPEQLNAIADSVKAGTPRRLKVRTLFGYNGLHRRRDAGIAAVTADLDALGLTTEPDFSTVGFDEQVSIKLTGQVSLSATAAAEPVEPELFRVESEATSGGLTRYRALLRTYDAYERFRTMIVNERLADVFKHVENARRTSRDTYPFVVIFRLNGNCTTSDLDFDRKFAHRRLQKPEASGCRAARSVQTNPTSP